MCTQAWIALGVGHADVLAARAVGLGADVVVAVHGRFHVPVAFGQGYGAGLEKGFRIAGAGLHLRLRAKGDHAWRKRTPASDPGCRG